MTDVSYNTSNHEIHFIISNFYPWFEMNLFHSNDIDQATKYHLAITSKHHYSSSYKQHEPCSRKFFKLLSKIHDMSKTISNLGGAGIHFDMKAHTFSVSCRQCSLTNGRLLILKSGPMKKGIHRMMHHLLWPSITLMELWT